MAYLSSSSITTVPDLVDWLNVQADRCDRKAMQHALNRPEFLRYRRMAAAARETAGWYTAQMCKGVAK